jgi:hypothetical protein
MEFWIAGQPWEPAPEGWQVEGGLEGWRLFLTPLPGGVRITAIPPDGKAPAVWMVTTGS